MNGPIGGDGTRAQLIACILLSIGLVECGGGGATQTDKPAAAVNPPSIDAVRVIQQPTNVILEMPGQLDPYETVAVYPKVTGFVKSIRVDRGSRVRTGELMAELDAPELVAQRAEAQSKLQAAEAQLAAARARADADTSTFERLKAAAATPGVVAGNDVVVAQKAVEADKSQIAAAQQMAEAARQAVRAISQMEGYLRVTAPFDGVVSERNVHPGTLVGPNSGPATTPPMLRVVENNRLRLVVPVPEAYTADVVTGGTVSFTVAAYPGQTFSGTVARIARAVDVKTRTMAIELDVANKEERLAPGTFCQVKWPVHRRTPSLFVPAESIASTTDRTFVVRVRNGKTEWVDVKTGFASGPLVEVFGDLQAGDQVAVRGTDEIKPGTEVQPRETNPASSSNGGARLRDQALGPLFQPEQHSTRHQKSCRLDRVREQPRPQRACTDPAAGYEPGSRLVNRIQPKLPHPIQAADVSHVQYERAIGFEDGHRPARTSSDRNVVTDGEVLELRQNARGARTIEVAEQAIERVVAVQPAALISNLHEPWPDVLGCCVDRNRRRSGIRPLNQQAVARHHAREV
jgi:RND family efflux transporter MFP subunit